MSMDFKVLAIDGGAGTGKSTTASILAERLGFLHVDTGSHYRSITRYLLDEDWDMKDIEGRLAENHMELSSIIEGRRSILAINEKIFPVASLRSKEVNEQVSEVAAFPKIREMLFDYQRGQIEVARRHGFSGLVMEGRDIGSVIFPDADLKVFLVADQRIRESRRIEDGEVDEIASRDELDSKRKVAPLKESEGSIRIDTSQLSVEEVFSVICDKIPS